jgi:hypothetical protein
MKKGIYAKPAVSCWPGQTATVVAGGKSFEGLSRFDGYEFHNYTIDDGLPHQR